VLHRCFDIQHDVTHLAQRSEQTAHVVSSGMIRGECLRSG
jgi:hypothetical protein